MLPKDLRRLFDVLGIDAELADCQKLLASGIDVNIAAPESGYTALHYAALQTWREFGDGRMKALLEAGANIEALATTQAGAPWTPLMLACAEGMPDQVIRLLQWKADPNVRDDIGRTPLIMAVSNVSYMSGSIPPLIASGANARLVTSFGETAISIFDETRREFEREDSKVPWDWLERLLRNA